MQLLTGFEADGLAGSDADLGTGPGIPSDAGFARTDAEDSEATQFDAITRRQSLFQTFEDGIYRRLGLGAGQACSLDDVMHDILFDQCPSPFIGKNFVRIGRRSGAA